MGKWMIVVVAVLALLLAACGGQEAALTVDVDGPALIMFYTDG